MIDSNIPQSPPADDNHCPICGKSLAFVGIQTYPAQVNRPDQVLVHCTNIDCDLFEQTATPEHLRQNWRDYLKDRRP